MVRRQPAATAPLAAVALPFATCLVQWLLWGYLKPFVWFLFYPTIFFSSRIGGKASGIVSTLVSALLVIYFFIPPQLSLLVKNPNTLVSVLVFIAMGIIFSYTNERLAKAELQGAEAEAAALQAREQLQKARLALLESEKRRCDANLQKSDERLAFALESSHIGVWELDGEGRISFFSRQFHLIFGYPARPAQWSYQTLLDQVLSNERPLVERAVRAAAAEGGFWELECRIRRRDGELRWVWLAGRYQQAATGEPAAMTGVIQDVTERRQAEEALRAVEVGRTLALDAAQAGTWEWELDTDRNVWSREVWNLYGLSESQCQPSYGCWLQTVLPEDRPRVEKALMGIVQQGAELNLEWRVKSPGGAERWLMSRGRPLQGPGGSITHYVGVVFDISERKSWEERLKRRNEELERFARASEEREFEMIRLKQQVNELCRQLGVEPPYDLAFLETLTDDLVKRP
ncbi:PAS domain-containing protein [Geomonas sp.]|uniref:PAS domain-containing protein n=1 Tax=Geomonas sp. TaxID=2651584 RepID=UPI002B4695F4|nr:PAS domain-containing protein [Geomonas sp.]HJV36741.1 PAS domain-containing protein [Geomonas sp.]